MQLSHAWSKATPTFDDENLVSCAGLVPVLALAEQAGLSELVNQRVKIKTTRVKSAGVNPAGKLTSIIAGMAGGADSIDDLDAVRSGGMGRLFAEVYAPATLGQFLREFTHGHSRQLASVARAHLVNLVQRTGLLPGIGTQAYVDIDSLLRPVYGHAKQGASFGHTKIAGKQPPSLKQVDADPERTPRGSRDIAGARRRVVGPLQGCDAAVVLPGQQRGHGQPFEIVHLERGVLVGG